jgi:hypothetical protein
MDKRYVRSEITSDERMLRKYTPVLSRRERPRPAQHNFRDEQLHRRRYRIDVGGSSVAVFDDARIDSPLLRPEPCSGDNRPDPSSFQPLGG